MTLFALWDDGARMTTLPVWPRLRRGDDFVSLGRFWALAKQIAVCCGYASRPSFLIIGAAKSGTTALHAYLSLHPHIRPAWDKEVHFFDQDVSYRRGSSWYHTRFTLPHRLARQAVSFCATPDYLFVPQCAERIYRYNPNLKLVAVLREPVERAYSFWHMLRNFHECHQGRPILNQAARFDPPIRRDYRQLFAAGRFPAFEDWVDRELAAPPNAFLARQPNLVQYGLYHEQLRRFYQWFKPDQILILDHQQLMQNTRAALDQVTDFLGLSRHDWDGRIEHKVGKQDYSIELKAATRRRLQRFFQPHNRALGKLTGLEFGW